MVFGPPEWRPHSLLLVIPLPQPLKSTFVWNPPLFFFTASPVVYFGPLYFFSQKSSPSSPIKRLFTPPYNVSSFTPKLALRVSSRVSPPAPFFQPDLSTFSSPPTQVAWLSALPPPLTSVLFDSFFQDNPSVPFAHFFVFFWCFPLSSPGYVAYSTFLPCIPDLLEILSFP